MRSLSPILPRVLLRLSPGCRRPIDPSEVFYLEADGGNTLVWLGKNKKVVDRRPLGDTARVFEAHGFVRVHRNHAVNLLRIAEVRRRTETRGWELKVDMPLGRILPVSEDRLTSLWSAYGD